MVNGGHLFQQQRAVMALLYAEVQAVCPQIIGGNQGAPGSVVAEQSVTGVPTVSVLLLQEWKICTTLLINCDKTWPIPFRLQHIDSCKGPDNESAAQALFASFLPMLYRCDISVGT